MQHRADRGEKKKRTKRGGVNVQAKRTADVAGLQINRRLNSLKRQQESLKKDKIR